MHLKRYRPGAPGHPQAWRSPSQVRRWPRLLPPPGGSVRQSLSQRDRGSPSPARSCAGVGAGAPGCASAALLRATSLLRGPSAAHPGKGEGIRAATLAEAKWTGSGVESRAGQDSWRWRRRGSCECAPVARGPQGDGVGARGLRTRGAGRGCALRGRPGSAAHRRQPAGDQTLDRPPPSPAASPGTSPAKSSPTSPFRLRFPPVLPAPGTREPDGWERERVIILIASGFLQGAP